MEFCFFTRTSVATSLAIGDDPYSTCGCTRFNPKRELHRATVPRQTKTVKVVASSATASRLNALPRVVSSIADFQFAANQVHLRLLKVARQRVLRLASAGATSRSRLSIVEWACCQLLLVFAHPEKPLASSDGRTPATFALPLPSAPPLLCSAMSQCCNTRFSFAQRAVFR